MEVAARCHATARLLVCLDYDGTLVPIAARPEEARPPSTVLRLLSQLAQAPDIDVAIVSGRPLANLRALLPLRGVAYIGAHGLEVCTATGEFTSLLPPGAFSTILTSLRIQIENLIAGVPGIFVENKGQAFALHYRLARPEAAEQLVAESLSVIRGYQGKGVALEVQHGKKVLEVLPVGVNKGKAVQFLLQPYNNTTLPLYIGDDATDENAFRVLNKRGVTILVADPPRRTSAQYHLRDPEEVWCFLTRLLETRNTGRSAS
jgi:trehalose 6-phosphate phosphatase